MANPRNEAHHHNLSLLKRLWILVIVATIWSLPTAGDPAAGETEGERGPSTEANSAESATPSEAAPEPTATVGSAAGWWIFLDPETGLPTSTPTAEQLARRQLHPGALNKSSLGLTPFKLENGGEGVYLQGRFRHALKARLNDQGQWQWTCTDHPEGFHDHPSSHDEPSTDATIVRPTSSAPAQ